MTNIFFIANGKGGVGKTMTTLAFIDYMLNVKKLQNILIIEADETNPEIYRTFRESDKVEIMTNSLSTRNGWIELLNLLGEIAGDKTIIVNTPARANETMEQNLPLLLSCLNEIDAKVKILWPINR